jgi:uncharacterized protein
MRVPSSTANPSNVLTIRQSRNTVRTVVPAAHGHAFKVLKGERFRVIDLHGEQIIDMMAYPIQENGKVDFSEKLSMAYTRYHLSGRTPQIGESLWTNRDVELLRITADTCRVHDMTFPSCFPELYEKAGFKNHRACATNIAEAMKQFGMTKHTEIADPFNIFQNTPLYSVKGGLGPSRPGDFIEFESSADAVIAVSSCPYDLDGFNGGKITDIEIVVNP